MGEEIAKIRMKIGQLEIEYEGSSSYLADGFLNLVEETASFYWKHRSKIPIEPAPAQTDGNASPALPPGADHSTNTIATKIKSKTGPDLIMAAAARLTLVENKERFTRVELLKEIQTASSFFKSTYRDNLSKYLKTMVKADRLRLVANNTYALPANEKKNLGAKLAEQE
ncbi:MAG: hypothetical protein ACFCUW_15155 [Kiloniellaceae bacterium]